MHGGLIVHGLYVNNEVRRRGHVDMAVEAQLEDPRFG